MADTFLDISLVLHHQLAVPFDDNPLAVMGIHSIGGVSYSIGDFCLPFAVGLGCDVFSHKPSRLSDVYLWGPMAVVDIFILRKSPAADLVLDIGWHSWVSLVKIEQAQGVVKVILQDLIALVP